MEGRKTRTIQPAGTAFFIEKSASERSGAIFIP
nr:MAG TPA: hypothetical protein [Caudoviricetes sp.]